LLKANWGERGFGIILEKYKFLGNSNTIKKNCRVKRHPATFIRRFIV